MSGSTRELISISLVIPRVPPPPRAGLVLGAIIVDAHNVVQLGRVSEAVVIEICFNTKQITTSTAST